MKTFFLKWNNWHFIRNCMILEVFWVHAVCGYSGGNGQLGFSPELARDRYVVTTLRYQKPFFYI